MIDKLIDLLSGRAAPQPSRSGIDLKLAVAALLVEAARMDQSFDAPERELIERLLAERFDLDAAAVSALISDAEARVSGSAQYFPFTHEIATSLDADERARIVEMLWRVAYADGRLDTYEDALVRQISGLIHVDDRARALARQRALASIEVERGGATSGGDPGGKTGSG